MLLLSGARLECVRPPRDMEMSPSPIITTGLQLSQPSILHSKASDCNSDILHMCNVVFVVGNSQLIKGLCSLTPSSCPFLITETFTGP